jgi:DNA-binding response OmpR family regulator
MMPKKDGFSLAKDIRAINAHIPIIFLTAKTLKEDRITGFKIGGDDYITKPFSTEELSLRISAILKRIENQYMKKTTPDVIRLGTIDFDYRNMILIHKEKKYSLTKKEAALLRLLAENKNELVERDYALEEIWGTSDYFIGRSMDVFIAKLRKILKLDPHIAIINVHGTGFKLEVSE